MTKGSSNTVVSSWNEWDPLKHVIVGRASGTMIQAPEPAVQNDWPQQGFPLGSFGPMPEEMEAKANELLDNFATILEKRGIRVDRPTRLDVSQAVQTADSGIPGSTPAAAGHALLWERGVAQGLCCLVERSLKPGSRAVSCNGDRTTLSIACHIPA